MTELQVAQLLYSTPVFVGILWLGIWYLLFKTNFTLQQQHFNIQLPVCHITWKWHSAESKHVALDLWAEKKKP